MGGRLRRRVHRPQGDGKASSLTNAAVFDQEARVEIGGYRVDPVVDGEGRLRPDEALPGVPAACWTGHRALLDDGGLLPIVIGGFLLRGRGRTVLVDLGYGPGALGGTPTGRMPSSLQALGVEPPDVTDVLFTHLHRDQGRAASGGVVMFPHARLWCGAADRAYFVEQLRPARRELDAALRGRRFRGRRPGNHRPGRWNRGSVQCREQ
jgi:glyoxylase-like metal-dependent hydrolase (beta-lactamase superfamily II)